MKNPGRAVPNVAFFKVQEIEPCNSDILSTFETPVGYKKSLGSKLVFLRTVPSIFF